MSHGSARASAAIPPAHPSSAADPTAPVAVYAAGSPIDGTDSPLATGSGLKRVTFDSAPALGESLLAGSFTESQPSSHSAVDADFASNGSGDIPLGPMSDRRLLGSSSDGRGNSYSSLNAMSESEDDDLPPPLEEIVTNGGGGCSSGDGHGHSHGSGGHNHRDSSCSSGSGGGRNSRSSASPSTPRRSPATNCGGMKKRRTDEKISKQEESNRKARNKLGWASVFCLIFMICEIIGGLIANSLAIMTDAAHLLSDLAGFLISIFALWLATRPATSRLSFGFHRAEILGALVSVLLIWVLTGVLVYEACWRLAHPEDVDGKIMFIVATAGLLCNFIMGMILIVRNTWTHNAASARCLLTLRVRLAFAHVLLALPLLLLRCPCV
jgi:hypothetical protein